MVTVVGIIDGRGLDIDTVLSYFCVYVGTVGKPTSIVQTT